MQTGPEVPPAEVPEDVFWLYAKRNMIRNDIVLALGALNALLEHRYVMGHWPDQLMLQRLGDAQPDQWATTWLSGIEVSSAGAVDFVLNEAAGGGRLEYRVQGDLERSFAWWQCRSSSRADAGLLVPGCTYVGAGPALAPAVTLELDQVEAEPHLARALRRSIAEDVSRVAMHAQVIIGEYYASTGAWPSLDRVGLATSQQALGRWTSGLGFVEPHTLVVQLNHEAGGGTLHYTPRLNQYTIAEWRCTSPDWPDVGRFMPGCTYLPPGAP